MMFWQAYPICWKPLNYVTEVWLQNWTLSSRGCRNLKMNIFLCVLCKEKGNFLWLTSPVVSAFSTAMNCRIAMITKVLSSLKSTILCIVDSCSNAIFFIMNGCHSYISANTVVICYIIHYPVPSSNKKMKMKEAQSEN